MANRQGTYAEASIRVLKGLEPVTQRPGMCTRTNNPPHTDGSVSINDDGREWVPSRGLS